VFNAENPRQAADERLSPPTAQFARKMEEFGFMKAGVVVKPFRVPDIALVQGWGADRMAEKTGSRQETRGAFIFLSPYLLLFSVFIVIPVLAAILLSLTYFNAIQPPSFIGLANYVGLLTRDEVFMQYVLPNTVKFALSWTGRLFCSPSSLREPGPGAAEAPHRHCPGNHRSADADDEVERTDQRCRLVVIRSASGQCVTSRRTRCAAPAGHRRLRHTARSPARFRASAADPPVREPRCSAETGG